MRYVLVTFTLLLLAGCSKTVTLSCEKWTCHILQHGEVSHAQEASSAENG